MKRALLVTVCGAVIVVGGLAGCSSNKSSTPSSSAPSTATATASATGSATASATAAAGATKVTIDGADQNVQGTVVCTNMGGNVQIAIGNATGGLGAQLSEGDSPTVKQVGLGNINGAALGYTAGVPGGEASATKDGSTYTITGKASGVDLSNPMQPVTKPFEIVVTCP